MKHRLALLRAFLLGLRDGWAQPHDLVWSANVDHLADADDRAYEWLDSGINVGQLARAGTRSQTWAEGYWPVGWGGGRES